jgi:hypothetical protein
MSALGQKRTCAVQSAMSALPPIATAKADMPQMVMSALPLKADMCGAVAHVRYGSEADISAAKNDVRFVPNSYAKADFRKMVCPLHAQERT